MIQADLDLISKTNENSNRMELAKETENRETGVRTQDIQCVRLAL